MGKYKESIKKKYNKLTVQELLIRLKYELIENMKYFEALKIIEPIFNKLNEQGLNLNTDFRKVATQECTDLIYCAYLRNIIPFEMPGNKKNIKKLIEQFQIEDIVFDIITIEQIILEQFQKEINKQDLSAINTICDAYFEDDRLNFDIDDKDYLECLRFLNEIERKRNLYIIIKSKYEKALSAVIKSYNSNKSKQRTRNKLYH